MRRNKQEHTYWAVRARTYDAATGYVIGEETQRETIKWLSRQFQQTDQVLELGYGTGRFSEVVAKHAGHLTATEGAVEMLDVAKRRLGPFTNTTVQLEDCYHTSFADGIFDVVFLGNVIHILGSPIKALIESRRILKPGGSILLVDSTTYGMTLWRKLSMGLRYLRKFGLPPKDNRFVSPDDVTRWLETAGFRLEASRLAQKETNVVCVRGRR